MEGTCDSVCDADDEERPCDGDFVGDWSAVVVRGEECRDEDGEDGEDGEYGGGLEAAVGGGVCVDELLGDGVPVAEDREEEGLVLC